MSNSAACGRRRPCPYNNPTCGLRGSRCQSPRDSQLRRHASPSQHGPATVVVSPSATRGCARCQEHHLPRTACAPHASSRGLPRTACAPHASSRGLPRTACAPRAACSTNNRCALCQNSVRPDTDDGRCWHPDPARPDRAPLPLRT
jgi:hypothetical protein